MRIFKTALAQQYRGELNSLLRSPFIGLVLCFFLAVDVFFVSAHVYHYLNNRFHFSPLQLSSNFILMKERGYSEWWEYIKTAFSSLMFAYAYVRSRAPVYFGMTVICLWALADNAFQLHEQARSALSPLFSVIKPRSPSAARGLGQVAYFAAMGLAFLVFLLVAYRYTEREHRINAITFAALFLLLAAFGVVVDALHAVLNFRGEIINHIFALVEDGGELIVLSLIAVASLFMARRLAGGQRVAPPRPRR